MTTTKKIVIGAMAMLALAACSNEEVIVDNRTGDTINFSPITGKSLSRAFDGYCNLSMPDELTMSAAFFNGSTTTPYFFNEAYTKSAGSGYASSGIVRYWPNLSDGLQSITFYGAVNATPSWKQTAGGEPDYTGMVVNAHSVTTDVAQQRDFLYAVQKATVRPADGVQSINFRHALSQIEFAGLNENPNIHVEICGVKVVNVFSKGDFAFPATTTDDNVVDHNFGGTYPAADKIGTWSNQSVDATYGVTFDATALQASRTSLTITDPAGKEYNANTMYLVPQQLEGWDRTATPKAVESADTYFLINAKIWNVAGAAFNPSADALIWGSGASGVAAGAKEIAIPAPDTNWQPGKRYVYTFKFTNAGDGGADPDNGNEVLTPIKLTVTIDDFVDGSSADVTMSK